LVYLTHHESEQANCIAAGNLSCLPQPWVYHPASYDPTNREWVERTVLDYYRLVGPADTCPYTSDETNLIQFNANFARSCPANTMNFFLSILQIIRIIATDVVMIASSLLHMLVELISLLFTGLDTGGFGAMKANIISSIRGEFAYIKKESRQMRDMVMDLFMDMLFTSGQLGTSLLNFLTGVCGKINEAYNWFMDVWCKYVLKHLTTFLSTLRKGLSMMASGFEILQDFMDEVFGGVLPASFMAKYAGGLFQSKLIEKYSQPMGRNKKGVSNVMLSARAAEALKAKRIAKATQGVGKNLLKNTLKSVPYIGALATVGFGAYEAYQTIQGIQNYPLNFTLFDFSEVFDGIDTFVDFLQNGDRTCYIVQLRKDFNLSTNLFQCFNPNFLDQKAMDEQSALTVSPTLCWASSRDSLGESNVFSCHSGSTCCETQDCTSRILCNQCPLPNFEGETRFACNTLSRFCQCAVPIEEKTRCSQNSHCSKGQCVLASSSSGISYGTLPCSQCPNANVYCMLTTSGLPGECTCFTESTVQQALCSDVTGQVTPVSAIKACGYSEYASSSLQNWQFFMDEIAMVSCAQVTTRFFSLFDML
jgi:hypothetical protein